MNRHRPNQFFGRDRDARRLFGANGYSPKQDQNHNACGKDESPLELAHKQGRDPTYTSFVKQSRTASTEPRWRFCVSRDWTCPVERCMFSAVQIPTHAFIHLVPVRCTQYIVCGATRGRPNFQCSCCCGGGRQGRGPSVEQCFCESVRNRGAERCHY